MYAGGGVWAEEWARCSRAGHSACEPVPTYARYRPCQRCNWFVLGERSRESKGEKTEKMGETGQLSCCMGRGMQDFTVRAGNNRDYVHTYKYTNVYFLEIYIHTIDLYTHMMGVVM